MRRSRSRSFRWRTPAHTASSRYRAFKADKLKTPSTGFIDGDFVQSFLDLSKDVQEQVMQGKSEHERLTVDKAEIVRLLEEVARVH